MGYPKSDYDLIGFKISTNKSKKYDAFIKNKHSGEIVKIPFGSRIPQMQHYKDSTPLKHYSYLNHNDEKRRTLYQQRFKHLYDPNEYSSTFFSYNYLW